jgi:glycerophosphoryl diester phosphodiesterase
MVIGHRGVSGWRQENSLAAFRMAAAGGESQCDGVELDIHAAADGTLVVHHDATLPSGQAISQLTGLEIGRERLPDGSAPPTLEQALDELGGLDVFVEAKGLPPSADQALLDLLHHQPDPTRLHVHSFDHRIVARLRRKAPWLSLGVLSASYPIHPVEQVLAAGATTLWQQWELIDADLVAQCATAGIAVVAWTVNSRQDGERLARMGVTGLCGNFPERLRG